MLIRSGSGGLGLRLQVLAFGPWALLFSAEESGQWYYFGEIDEMIALLVNMRLQLPYDIRFRLSLPRSAGFSRTE